MLGKEILTALALAICPSRGVQTIEFYRDSSRFFIVTSIICLLLLFRSKACLLRLANAYTG